MGEGRDPCCARDERQCNGGRLRLFFQSSLRDLFFCCAFPALASLRAGLLSFAPAALVSTAEDGCAPTALLH
jgi:hypothetical protein